MTSEKNRPLLITIVGPTAVGKTALSIALAQHFDTAIISADSRQMYKDIPIGTACPSVEEQEGIPHYFLAHLELEEVCNAGQFERGVIRLIENELNKKDVIIMCGGSGLFVKAVLEGLDDVPKDSGIRSTLNQRLTQEGLPSLVEELKILDPVCALRIDAKNPQRVIRALEVCLASGRPFSSFLSATPKERPFDSLLIGLRIDRQRLEDRIRERCDQMLSSGWIEEARAVSAKRHLNSLNTIGYSQLFEYLDGSMDLETCKERIVTESMQFAKRQMTWFKKMKDLRWIEVSEKNSTEVVLELVISSVHR